MSRAIIDTLSRLHFFISALNVFSYCSPWRHFKLWNNYRTITNDLTPHLRGRISELQNNHQMTNKTLIDLLVKGLNEESGQTNGTATMVQIDDSFIDMAVGQIVLFLFAGHDTTGVSVCWLIHLLAQHPEIMAKMRAEHDAILGSDHHQAANVLKENPQLLTGLTYTHAAIKESMRVQTNIGTVRRGEPGFFLVGPPGSGPGFEGKMLPTDGFIVWDGNFAIHRDPDLWHRADEFLPERFLTTDPNDPLYPPKHAWRSFELGPRDCVGQNLAMVEIKLVMALIARRFDVECAWEKWDAFK